MNTLRRYFTMLGALALLRLLTACSDGSSGLTASERASAAAGGECQGEDDDGTGSDDADDGGDDADEPGDVDCGDDED